MKICYEYRKQVFATYVACQVGITPTIGINNETAACVHVCNYIASCVAILITYFQVLNHIVS